MLGLTAGCADVRAPADADMSDDVELITPVTRTYVIGLIQTATVDTATAYGFDLDHMHNGMAASCTDAADFEDPYGTPSMASLSACAGHHDMASCAADAAHHCLFGANGTCYADGSGIDNQLSAALPTLGGMLGPDGADGAFRDQIEAGRMLLMLEVSGITSFTNTPQVGVHMVLAQVSPQGPACHAHADMASCTSDSANLCAWSTASTPGCSTTARPAPSTECAAHADMTSCTGDIPNACNWSMTTNACSGIAAGQTFAITHDRGTVAGSITNGRLSTVVARLPRPLPLQFTAMGRNISLLLHIVAFGGRITATNITSGQLGGALLVSDILAQCPTGMACRPDMLADLGPDATGAHCGGISAGLGYTAIAATLR